MSKRINYLAKKMDSFKPNASGTIITSLSLSKETLRLEAQYKAIIGSDPPRSRLYTSKLREIINQFQAVNAKKEG